MCCVSNCESIKALISSEFCRAICRVSSKSRRARLPARDFAFKLLRERGVSVAPGTAFGDVAAGAVRISLASSDSDLREGVGRLAEFVHQLS